MKLKVSVMDESPETWFKGSKDERSVRTLLLFDAEPYLQVRFKNTLEYTLTPDEALKVPAGSLTGSVINVAVRELKPGQGGRMKIQGQLDLSSLPKALPAAK